MITRHILQRVSRLRRDQVRSKALHELYPPSKGVDNSWAVILAYDPAIDRWVLCYDAEDVFVEGDSATMVRVLKPFYIWQGPDDLYLEPDTARIADWLRSHDMLSGDYTGTWEDRQFGLDEARREDAIKQERNEDRDILREMYSMHRAEIRRMTPTRNTPLPMGKYFDVSRVN